MVRIAINGFGRIGRMVFRAGLLDPEFDVVAINDLTSPETLAYLLRHDSVHGPIAADVAWDDEHLIVDGNRIRVFAERDPAALPWRDFGIDVVVESTGFFTHRDGAAKHLEAGARKVLISAPGKGVDLTIVKGVNEHEYDPDKHHVVSNASCTTNNIAPIVKVMCDNFGVEKCFFVTVHAYTSTQSMIDAPNHKDLRRGRAAAQNIVPTTTGAAKAVIEVIPELAGCIDGHAMRVPVADGSITDMNFVLKREVSEQEIHDLFRSVAHHHLHGVLAFTDEPLVSTDIIGTSVSTTLDSRMTRVMGNFVKVQAWYDNEYGYSCRVVDVAKILAQEKPAPVSDEAEEAEGVSNASSDDEEAHA